MIRIKETRVEYTDNPIGISKNPRFQWRMESDNANTLQIAYELQIAEDEGFEKNVFIERKNTRQSAHVKVQGLNLEALRKYYYRVKVWDNNGEETEYSRIGFFVTANLA